MEEFTGGQRPPRRQHYERPHARPRRPVRTVVTDLRPQAIQTPAASPPAPARRRRHIPKPRLGRKKMILCLLILIILAAGGGIYWYFKVRTVSPVPKNIQAAVKFPIYYPNQTKLPDGYTLSKSSFTTRGGALLFAINYPGGKLVVSEQAKPAGNVIDSFAALQIPLHRNYQAPIGTAVIGAYDNRTIVSLPTSTKTWLLFTAPVNIDQSQLKQVLSSFRN